MEILTVTDNVCGDRRRSGRINIGDCINISNHHNFSFILHLLSFYQSMSTQEQEPFSFVDKFLYSLMHPGLHT